MVVEVTPRPDYDDMFENLVRSIAQENPTLSEGIVRLKAAQIMTEVTLFKRS